MVSYVVATVETEKPITITCDVCNRSWDWSSSEAQEFISIRQEGGFASVFGDGTLISLDLCQECLMEKLGDWIYVN